jgi:hypothetical protein
MKKLVVLCMVAAVGLSCAACGSDNGATQKVSTESNEAAKEKAEGVMSYEEYAAADMETEVVVETYVQAKQSWYEGAATFYTQDEDGAYFIYKMDCSEEDYEKLTAGTKIKVTGYKSEWSGEVEIVDATFEIEDGTYVADAVDLTGKLSDDTLEQYQNQYFSVAGLTVEASSLEDGTESAFLYDWDGSGVNGSDLYFKVSDGTYTYTFAVESNLYGPDTDVYEAVKSLNVGDTIDVKGSYTGMREYSRTLPL